MFVWLYILVCLVWGVFAVGMQKKLYPQKSTTPDLVLNFIVNSLGCPISMIWAAFCLFNNSGWASKI